MTVLKALMQLRDLLRQNRNWCKGAYARDAIGREVSPTSKQAKQWDLEGGLMLILGTRNFYPRSGVIRDYLKKGVEQTLGKSVESLASANDSRLDHGDVTVAIDSAIGLWLIDEEKIA